MAERHVLAAGARVEPDPGLVRLLDALDDPRTARSIRRGAIAAGANVIARRARATTTFQSHSGQLRDSIRVRTKVRGDDVQGFVFAGSSRSTVFRRGRAVSGRYKVAGKYRVAFYAAFVEFGTRPHRIDARGKALAFGGRAVRSVRHGGARARKYMQRALESGRGEAALAIDAYIERRLRRLEQRGKGG